MVTTRNLQVSRQRTAFRNRRSVHSIELLFNELARTSDIEGFEFFLELVITMRISSVITPLNDLHQKAIAAADDGSGMINGIGGIRVGNSESGACSGQQDLAMSIRHDQ